MHSVCIMYDLPSPSPQSRSSSAPRPQALWDMARGYSGEPGCLVPKATIAVQTPHRAWRERELFPVDPGDHCGMRFYIYQLQKVQ